MLTVGVSITTYNRANALADAIESVLRQTYTPLEILVIDDGLTDATPEVVQRFEPRVRRLAQANRGPAAARNLGIVVARGDVLGFLDDDDAWLPDEMEWGIMRLQDPDAPRVDIVCGMTWRVRVLRIIADG